MAKGAYKGENSTNGSNTEIYTLKQKWQSIKGMALEKKYTLLSHIST